MFYDCKNVIIFEFWDSHTLSPIIGGSWHHHVTPSTPSSIHITPRRMPRKCVYITGLIYPIYAIILPITIMSYSDADEYQ